MNFLNCQMIVNALLGERDLLTAALEFIKNFDPTKKFRKNKFSFKNLAIFI